MCSFCSASYCLYALYSYYLPAYPCFILLHSAQCLRTLNFPENIQRALLIGLVGSHQQEPYEEGKCGEWMSLVPWSFSSFYWVVLLVFQTVVGAELLFVPSMLLCSGLWPRLPGVKLITYYWFLKTLLQRWVFCQYPVITLISITISQFFLPLSKLYTDLPHFGPWYSVLKKASLSFYIYLFYIPRAVSSPPSLPVPPPPTSFLPWLFTPKKG